MLECPVPAAMLSRGALPVCRVTIANAREKGRARMGRLPPRPGMYYGWCIVATTFCMALVSMGARSGFGGFVLPMRAEFGWQRGTISLAAAIGALVSGLSQPFLGRLYDRLGGRRLILASLIVSGVCTMLLALTTHILFLILLFGGVLLHRHGRQLPDHHRRPARPSGCSATGRRRCPSTPLARPWAAWCSSR